MLRCISNIRIGDIIVHLALPNSCTRSKVNEVVKDDMDKVCYFACASVLGDYRLNISPSNFTSGWARKIIKKQ